MKKSIGTAAAVMGALALAPVAHAEDVGRTANNTIYLELGGNGLFYSLNYERIFPYDIGARIGFSYLSFGASSGTASASVSSLGIPITASYLGLGGRNHKFELGGGLLLERFSGSASSGFGQKASAGALYPMFTGIAGYRYSPANGGFNFRAAYTPAYHPDLGLFHWGGLAFGYGF